MNDVALFLKYFQFHYTFTSFDIETLDLEDFKYNQVNITAFRWEACRLRDNWLHHYNSLLRFVDSESPMVQEVLSEMEAFSPVGSKILNKSGVNRELPHSSHIQLFVFCS